MPAEKRKIGLSPSNKNRIFAMGGFSSNKLDFDDEGLLSDDGESYDLDELSGFEKDLTDEEICEIVASKHRFKDDKKVFHIAIIDYL